MATQRRLLRRITAGVSELFHRRQSSYTGFACPLKQKRQRIFLEKKQFRAGGARCRSGDFHANAFNPNSEIGIHDLTQSVGGKAICRNST
jgi:hypothetical protein